MLTLFASPEMTSATIAVLLTEFLSVTALSIGVLSYRSLVNSRHELLSALHHGEQYDRHVPFGRLVRFYVFSSLLIILFTSAMFLWQSLSSTS